MDIHSRICNLCLVKCNDFKFIKEDRKTVLDVLLPIKEFAPIQEPVICTNCEEVLIKCFGFKSKCLHSYDYVVSLVNVKDSDKLDLRDVYLSQNVTNTDVSVDQNVCCFCMCLVENCYAVSLEVDVKGRDIILQKMMEQCLPELDLSIIKNPIICTDCHRSLENCFRFVTNCLTAEEKIKKYCESLDSNSRGPIELSGLLHSTMRTVEASDTVVIIEGEEPFCVKMENSGENEICNAGDVKLEHMSRNDSQCVNESESFISLDNRKVNDTQLFTPKNMQTRVEEGNILGTFKIEETFCAENETKTADPNFGEMDVQTFVLKDEEIEIKSDETDLNRFEGSIDMTETIVNTKLNSIATHLMTDSKEHKDSNEDPSVVTMFKCNCCSYQTKYKANLRRHIVTHDSSLKITMFKCDSCPYQSRWKQSLKFHMVQHMDLESEREAMFKCHVCSFQTIYKEHFKNHSITHKASSEIAMFKCDSCPFQARWKRSLRDHMLKHMDPSKVTMLSCNFCSFQSKYKQNLRQHLITHKPSTEMTTFKCYSCPFQTKWKATLKNHMLKHMDCSELKIFTCDFCSYETKNIQNLKKHLITHKTSSETTMFKCGSCPFQAKRKQVLKNHMVKHMDSSDVKMFSCDVCSYQTKYKQSLRSHIITHKSSSEITLFKCDSCPYQTKWKQSLKAHMLQHVDPTKVTMFKCKLCSYQTKYKEYLKIHHLTHKASSEIIMSKCGSCPYQAKSKYTLKNHMLKHKDPSKVTMLTCNFCSYETIYKRRFKHHLITHKPASTETPISKCDLPISN